VNGNKLVVIKTADSVESNC